MPGALDFDAAAALAALRARRAAQGAPPPNPPKAPNPVALPNARLGELGGLGGGQPENRPARPDGGLSLTAARIAATLADGAEREEDADGWLVLVLSDGRRHVVAPQIAAALVAAGLMPDLPPALPRSTYAARARPPSWSDPDDRPREGDRCGTCGSGRWWTEAQAPDGWCCSTCHPPPPGLVVATSGT